MLRTRALSARTGTAISEMIRRKLFLLSEFDISNLASRGDEIIAGWIFAYNFLKTLKVMYRKLRV